jgi:hypothetical protein
MSSSAASSKKKETLRKKGRVYHRVRNAIFTTVRECSIDPHTLVADAMKEFQIAKSDISTILKALRAYMKIFSKRGTQSENNRKAKDTLLTMLCWDEPTDYRTMCKELDLQFSTYTLLFDKAKVRAEACKLYLQEKEKFNQTKKNPKKNKKTKNKNKTANETTSSSSSASSSSTAASSAAASSTATHAVLSQPPPEYFSARNKRKDATDIAVTNHARAFFHSISSRITSKAVNGKKRMDMSIKEAYTKWLEQIKMPVANDGMNKPSGFHVSLSVFIKCKPKEIMCMGREFIHVSDTPNVSSGSGGSGMKDITRSLPNPLSTNSIVLPLIGFESNNSI